MTYLGKTALILGSTGLVGSLCLDFLLAGEQYDRVIAVSRRPLDRSHPKLINIVTDFENLSPIESQLKADDVFCAIGTTIRHAGSKEKFRTVDFNYPLSVAEIAVKNGARQMVLISSVGANKESSAFYLRVKGELEQALAQLPFASLHILRPAMLDGKRSNERFRERVGVVFSRAIAFLLVGPLKKYRAILAADVARVMLQVAQIATPGVHIYESDQIQSIADKSSRA